MALETGLHVHVIEGGDADAPAVVLVHGWAIHSHLWKRNVHPLLDAGWRVIAVDLPGHGRSDRPLEPGSYTLDALVSHVGALFRALGLDRAVVVAQSMGGRIATEFALREPKRVRALALIGSVGFGEVPSTVALAEYLPAPSGQLSTVLVQRWMVALGKGFAYGRRVPVKAEDVDAYWAPTQFPDFVPAMRQVLVEFDWRVLPDEVIARVAPPTLLMFGTRDRMVRPDHAEARASLLPRGRFRWVRDAGHVPNEEAPEEVNPLLVDFISGSDQLSHDG